MVFTAHQVTAFFEDADQMAVSHRTRLQLAHQGLAHPSDLEMLDSDAITKLAKLLDKPNGRIQNPDANAAIGDMIPTPSYELSLVSWVRLEQAAELVRYYVICGRALTAANMQWEPIIKTNHLYWKSVAKHQKDAPPVLPKITKALPIMAWQESFDMHLSRMMGARDVPLSYVIRPNVAAADPLPPLLAGKPYSADNGSVRNELIATASHEDGLFVTDNRTVHYHLTQATQGTSYASSVTPFLASEDGRAAYMALQNQFSGPDKWQDLLRQQKEFYQNRKWTGQSSVTLQTHVSNHRHAHVMMTQCKRHIHVEVPSDFSRVTQLLDSIECDNPRLQAALSQIRTDDSPTGLQNNFESAVAVMVPHCPVQLGRSTKKRGAGAMISDVTGKPAPTLKVGKGKTGVDLRFHRTSEFVKLSRKQKLELKEYRDEREAQGLGRDLPGAHTSKKSPGKKPKADKEKDKGKTKANSDLAALISAAIVDGNKESVKAASKVSFENAELTRLKALVSSMEARDATPAESDSAGAVSSTTAAKPPAVCLQGILNRAKHG
jgi:hypothetical protein